MADGAWSPTPNGRGQFHGIPKIGCWFRTVGENGELGTPVFISGGAHQHWNATGAEDGLLGFPTSNLDPSTGIQDFENGVVFWDGDEWRSGREPKGAVPPQFDIPPPPNPPLG